MKLVKCPKCGKHLHKISTCIYCGNTGGFIEIPGEVIHKNITFDYAHVDYLIESKKFNEAIELSHTVIEWMPNLPGVFWLRLLAKNKCTNDLDLILHGFNCENDSDFCNAVRFASKEEQEVYVSVGEIVKKLKGLLKTELIKNEKECKSKTNILNINNSILDEINNRKKRLFELWTDLENIEQSMYKLEMDCRSLSKEHITSLEKAAQSASQLKTEIYKLDQCTAESLNAYQVKLGGLLRQSEDAKTELINIKNQHPWVKSFNEFERQRDDKIKQIRAELDSLKNYENTVNNTLIEIEKIENIHKEALDLVDKYDFTKALELVKQDVLSKLLQAVGINVNCYSCVL